MCGLVGVYRPKQAGQHQAKEKDMFTTMLYGDYVRGKDSTGVHVAYLPKMSDTEAVSAIYKRNVAVYDYMFLPGYTNLLRAGAAPRLLQGHNRAATRGAVNNHNAHPFREGNIILTHNGTLHNERALPDNEYFSTDSNLIAHLINEKGLEETLNLIEGSYALTWWNTEEQSFNMVRNSQRPLFYANLAHGNSLVYASEEGLIRWAAEHHDIVLEDETDDQLGTVYSIDPATHFKWQGDLEPEVTTIDIKPKQKNYGKNTRTYSANVSNINKHRATNEANEVKLDAVKEVLTDLIGERIPVVIGSVKAVVNGDNSATGKQALTCAVEREYFTAVIPECRDIEVIGRATTEMSMQKVADNLGVVWIATLRDYTVFQQGSRIILLLKDPVPVPKYDISQSLEALSEEKKSTDPEGEEQAIDALLPAPSGYRAKSYPNNEHVKGPGGIYIPATDYHLLCQSGCASCGRELDSDDAEGLVWVHQDYPVCAECVSEDRDTLLDQNFYRFGFED